MSSQIISTICWRHLREFYGGMGLKTKIGGRVLWKKRLEVVRKRRFTLWDFMTSPSHSGWFRRTHRGQVDDDDMGSLKYRPEQSPALDYD